jgi:diguanylate cyclase (GGDEF)-like protein
LLFIDLDEFKDINDTVGHACGDQLLAEAAERLRASVRKTDLVARVGGDEFVVLLSQMQELQAADSISRKIPELLAQPF